MEKYVELIKDQYPYRTGTQFAVDTDDDGFWCDPPYFSAKIDGKQFSCDIDCGKYIPANSFRGTVLT